MKERLSSLKATATLNTINIPLTINSTQASLTIRTHKIRDQEKEVQETLDQEATATIAFIRAEVGAEAEAMKNTTIISTIIKYLRSLSQSLLR